MLDAYAVVAMLKDEPAAAQVESLLRTGEPAVLTTVGVAEVLDHLIRVLGVNEEDAALDLAELRLEEAQAVLEPIGAGSGWLRARHYHRTRCAVSLADCVAAETARHLGARLATSDPHLLDVCHVEGIEVHPLAASDGTTWAPT